MSLISTTDDLAAFCDRLSREPFVAVDTEFMREKTYWPKLCLIQVAGESEAACVDPLAPGLSLEPLFALMDAPQVLKVFHAARQDLEIFLHESGRLPHPLFDSQVAAMVCGYGDSVGYETLVSSLTRARIDKSMRFTDWSRRPLTPRQVEYALGDVIHLRTVYQRLQEQLTVSGRAGWLDQEMAVLTDPAQYRVEPDEAWLRIKARSRSSRFLALLKELAAWRERTAQERDLPRNRVIRDEGLLEIAASAPTTPEALAQLRSISRGLADGPMGQGILEAVLRAQALPESGLPRPPQRDDLPQGLGPVVDLLRVLLKMKCEESGVAQKLVATIGDLERIAADDAADVPAMEGWRRALFGEDALRLKHGQLALALTADGQGLRVIPLEG
ncbi:ribonuclease D [Pararhodospirillum photometricum]|uniref:Ribonuclease D n=1 Tax=Pararhodospirillum photometricum DSM 122 TaxID=1150469 RepID=H6SP19_PARPM|nr:ribonuclease D [Pararhodospirillum photometricum]CCG07091.1 Ribonuclease D [Pararhodospirillum photometricum DSM 122]